MINLEKESYLFTLRSNYTITKSYSWPMIILGYFLGLAFAPLSMVFFVYSLIMTILRINKEKVSMLKHSKSTCAAIVLVGAAEENKLACSICALAFIAVGISLIVVGNNMKIRGTRYSNYFDIIEDNPQPFYLIDDLAVMLKTDYKTVADDLKNILAAGYLPNAYLDDHTFAIPAFKTAVNSYTKSFNKAYNLSDNFDDFNKPKIFS